jgi:5-methylcytosine-specific restriction endonuclease McrA
MTYEEQLKDHRWLEKREQILQRDWRMCQHCMSGKSLNVHHKYYTDGKMAWEYPNSALVTLCDKCHKVEHNLSEDGQPKDFYELKGDFIRETVGGIYALMAKENEKKNG